MIMKSWVNVAAIVLTLLISATNVTAMAATSTTINEDLDGPSPARLILDKSLRGSTIQTVGNTAKIVGGSIASVNEYPWYTALNTSGNSFYCGGQLISPKFVLTAAHCEPKVGDKVQVGALCPANNDNCGQDFEARTVKSVTQHPDYIIHITIALEYDFMLIELDEAVNNINPVVLDNGSYSTSYKAGKSLWAIGLGIIDVDQGTLASRLQHAVFEYVPQDTCKEAMKPTLLGPATICAEDSDKRSDACNGDSGGPLYDRENQRLVGLTSYGDPTCVSTRPGVYARISDSFSWIQFNVCLADPTAGLCNDVIAPGTSAPTSKWCRDAEVQVTLNTDEYPEETVWYLSELKSFAFISAGSLSTFTANETHEGDFCLPVDNNQCYRLDIDDLAGDGIDKNGNDNDYCLILNGQEVECNTDFTGHREAVTFPTENCENDFFCNMTSYEIEITTDDSFTGFVDIRVHIEIASENGEFLFPYVFGSTDSFSGLASGTVYKYPIDLCDGAYNLIVENLRNTAIVLKRKNGTIILTHDDLEGSMFSTTSSARFGSSSASSLFKVTAILLPLMSILVSFVF